LEAKTRITADKPESAFNEIDVTCDFVSGATTSTDDDGKYLDMTVTLEVTDRDGDSNTASRTIKLYTGGTCGF
jgi:hypothetical protein